MSTIFRPFQPLTPLMPLLFLLILLTGCTGIPTGVTAIEGFTVNRYLGTWYEIARLDQSFERGLDNISATYSTRQDGGIRVLNKGRNTVSGEWQQAEGKAYFIDDPTVGRLKVSFFGPFYGGYNIIALDQKDYTYAMIAGAKKSDLWILSRTPQLPENTLNQLINEAKAKGFETEKLIFVDHTLPQH